MFKRKTIFILFLAVNIALFLSSIIWAQERTIFFEKGDALYLRGSISGPLGHAGLYWELNLFKNIGGI